MSKCRGTQLEEFSRPALGPCEATALTSEVATFFIAHQIAKEEDDILKATVGAILALFPGSQGQSKLKDFADQEDLYANYGFLTVILKR